MNLGTANIIINIIKYRYASIFKSTMYVFCYWVELCSAHFLTTRLIQMTAGDD